MVVAFTKVTAVAAAPPKVAVAPALKFAPLIVTWVLPAGLVAVQLVVVGQLTFVARLAPKLTVAVGAKSVPVIVTTVPPAVGPLVGLMEMTVGGVMKVKQLLQVALWPSRLVTTTLT